MAAMKDGKPVSFATRRLLLIGMRSTGLKRRRGHHPAFLEFPMFILLGALAMNPDLMNALKAAKQGEVA